MHADMTPITKQFSKIILNKVKEYKALTEPSYKKKKKKKNKLFSIPSFFMRGIYFLVILVWILG